MRRKELTPAQSYMVDAARILAMMVAGQEITEEQRATLLARPSTLKSALNAAFHKSTNGYYNLSEYL